MLQGKGFFIWQIEKCAPDAATLVSLAQSAGLKHVIVKIADGDKMFPIDDPDDSKEKLTQDGIAALKNAGIDVWGWSFIYGTDPSPEEQAKRLVQRMHYFGLEGAVINAEKRPNNPWTPENATKFMDTLINNLARAGITNPMLALSSYRYISYHPDFPFDEFMLFCQVAMPQVYWVAKSGGDPIRNLQDAYEEYNSRYPTKEFIPTGATYGETVALGSETFYWEARPDQVTLFMNQAAAMDVPAVNFWSWQHALENPPLWDAVKSYPFQEELQPISNVTGSGSTTMTATTTTSEEPGGGFGTSGTVTAAVGLPDTTDDDDIAVITVGAPGYQEGIYGGATAELVSFIREGYLCSWVKTEPQRSSAYAQWLARIGKDGEYLIEVWIPGINATTRRARYNITGVVGQQANTVVELNQLNFSDEWVRLGLFELDGEHQFSGMVTLNNLTGTEPSPDTQIAFGPVRWRKIERTGIPPGFADGFDSPVGTEAERRSDKIWPGQWVDANPYLNYYFLGYHTGADLNLPRDEDRGAPCYSIADGEVTYSGRAVNRDGSPSGFWQSGCDSSRPLPRAGR